MREILFRAWDNLRNKMVYNFNVLAADSTPIYIIGINDDGVPFAGTYDDNNDWHDMELMQFTGLLDKQGKKIFEGDIVKCNWLAELGITELDCEASGVVQWNDENPCFYVHLLKTYERHIGNEMSYEETDLGLAPSTDEGIHIEVIGNIHDTPKQ